MPKVLETHDKTTCQTKSHGCSSVSGTSSRRISNEENTEDIQKRVQRHPCYSEEAHHFFARMHVPVAPKCNIQCKYCNRKYDCMNESRPGVTSEVLTPEEACEKVLTVGSIVKRTTVVGIAGPGDPLANPEKTFQTFSLIRQAAPDMQLCLSTNGLVLHEYVDIIKELGIDHVTVTLNAVDPEIGRNIYGFVRWKGKTYRGYDAANILLENQLDGISKLTEKNILVKINSVLIPGINDQHMKDVSRKIREMGVFLHNIMPLIIADGSEFEKMGVLATDSELLANTQEACEPNGKLMRHCRQCRADAIGLLGEDRSAEFTKDQLHSISAAYDIQEREKLHTEIDQKIKKLQKNRLMQKHSLALRKMDAFPAFKVAVATNGNQLVNEHFGHAKEFQIYQVSSNGIKFMTSRKVDIYCENEESCGDNEDRLAKILKIMKDCEYLLCMRIGPEPMFILEQNGIQPVITSGSIDGELFQLAERKVKQNSEARGIG